MLQFWFYYLSQKRYLIKLSVAGAGAGAVAGAGAGAEAEIRICGSVEPEQKEIFSAPQHWFLCARMNLLNLFYIWTWSKVEQDPFSLKTPWPQWYGSKEILSVIFADRESNHEFCLPKFSTFLSCHEGSINQFLSKASCYYESLLTNLAWFYCFNWKVLSGLADFDCNDYSKKSIVIFSSYLIFTLVSII